MLEKRVGSILAIAPTKRRPARESIGRSHAQPFRNDFRNRRLRLNGEAIGREKLNRQLAAPLLDQIGERFSQNGGKLEAVP